MAEKQSDLQQESRLTGILAVSVDEVAPVNRKPKRCSSSEADMAPPNKSPRTDDIKSHVSRPDAPEVRSGTNGLEMRSENTEEASQSPPKRRKSYRRASLARRSLASLPKPCQNGTLDKLMESSMKMAVKRLQNTLQSVPNSSMESFQKRVDSITRECASLADTINSEVQNEDPPARPCDPAVQKSMENMRKAINLLKAESNSWQVLLDQHRSKANDLQKKVAEAPQKTGSIDYTSISYSSQYQLIKDKPNYSAVLTRPQPMLQTMEMIMDTQSKMLRELLSIEQQAHLIVKETSVRLRTAAGFHELPHVPMMKLLGGPSPPEAP
ncbi:kinetochore-associated protein DSN1 homolog isoform X1 [Synchiropus splendidus]|uniref:kinetochore-associated protein DSN1 homolog isoform X1 n=2 Tax=Synchiropus splendidus TaxID=270530 RepID=UPI00237D6C22|nr:kinetochore-associated protein DSN1 homolog isoform X1 [Synchiropus splendidus]